MLDMPGTVNDRVDTCACIFPPAGFLSEKIVCLNEASGFDGQFQPRGGTRTQNNANIMSRARQLMVHLATDETAGTREQYGGHGVRAV